MIKLIVYTLKQICYSLPIFMLMSDYLPSETNEENVFILPFIYLYVFFIDGMFMYKLQEKHFKKQACLSMTLLPYLTLLLKLLGMNDKASLFLGIIKSLLISGIILWCKCNIPSMNLLMIKLDTFDKDERIFFAVSKNNLIPINRINYSEYDGFIYYDKNNQPHHLSENELRNGSFVTSNKYLGSIGNIFKNFQFEFDDFMKKY